MPSVFNISGRHLEVTPALDQYARKQLSKLDVFNQITTVHVVLSIDNKLQKAFAKVKFAGEQNEIVAEAETEDMYKSIDELDKKIFTLVKKYHDKLTDHHR